MVIEVLKTHVSDARLELQVSDVKMGRRALALSEGDRGLAVVYLQRVHKMSPEKAYAAMELAASEPSP